MTVEIDIVGGSYGEECTFPRRRVWRGSGGRAAALLSSLGARTVLHTVAPRDYLAHAQSLAGKLGYQLKPTESSQAVWFRYRFPLGRPEIHPQSIDPVEQSGVRTKHTLVFGMMEGRPLVEAEKVVYDPQDGAKSRPFSANGSIARSLAQVVSLSEGRALTQATEPDDIATALLSHPGCEVVVVKCGPQGALVATPDNRSWIHSFPTSNVYKIGSGDVFSAVFAHAWMCLGDDALSAAWIASRCVAHYVERATDRFTPEEYRRLREEALARRHSGVDTTPRIIPQDSIYLAAPFFNVGQQWVVDETREALQDIGFNVFSPIHDVGAGLANDVAGEDLEALERSGVVLAILDGWDPGTLFEVGYAMALGIPVVAVAENMPQPTALTMFEGTGCDIVRDLTTGIYRTCWTLMGDV